MSVPFGRLGLVGIVFPWVPQRGGVPVVFAHLAPLSPLLRVLRGTGHQAVHPHLPHHVDAVETRNVKHTVLLSCYVNNDVQSKISISHRKFRSEKHLRCFSVTDCPWQYFQLKLRKKVADSRSSSVSMVITPSVLRAFLGYVKDS